MRALSKSRSDLLGVFGVHLERVQDCLALSDAALSLYTRLVTLSYWCNDGVFIPVDDLPAAALPSPCLYELVGSGLLVAVFDAEGAHAGYELPVWRAERNGDVLGAFAEHLMIR